MSENNKSTNRRKEYLIVVRDHQYVNLLHTNVLIICKINRPFCQMLFIIILHNKGF